MKKLLLCLALLLSTAASFADPDPRSSLNPIRLIEITAEYYPGETYHLGYAENADHSINSIFYEDQKHKFTYFNLADLEPKDLKAILQVKDGGKTYDLIRLSVVRSKTGNSYDVTLSYMKNGLFKGRAVVPFVVTYSDSLQRYELKDANTQSIVGRAHAITNYWGKKAVGIDYIQIAP